MTFLAVFLALLPGFAWLFFYSHEESHPEPKRFIAATFIAGILAGVVTYFIQNWMQKSFFGTHLGTYGFFGFAVFAAVEELFKFGAAKLAVSRNPYFNDPVDPMIYMIVAALGFATLENLGAILGQLNGVDPLNAILSLTAFRFVGATLLHTLSSGIFGYHWAISIRQFGSKAQLFMGFVLATILHTGFNYLIIGYGSAAYPVLLLTLVGFFVLGDFEELKHRRV